MWRFLRRLLGRKREPTSRVDHTGAPRSASPAVGAEVTKRRERTQQPIPSPRNNIGAKREDGKAVPIQLPYVEHGESAPPTKPRQRQKTDVIIGLDFGTSCSKVVVRAPFIGDGSAWAVPIGDATRGDASRYLRPTPFDATVGSLKAALMREPRNPDIVTRAAFYLSDIIEDSKAWLLKDHAELFGQYDVRWQVAVGCPSDSIENDIAAGFASAAKLAARDDRIATNVYPEMAGSTTGYARSDQRSRKATLHLLVDVGATTLDVCGFVLTQRAGEDQYNVLAAAVECLGAHELHYARLRSMTSGEVIPEMKSRTILDPMSEIPSGCESYMGLPTDALLGADRAFKKACVDQLMRCLHSLKVKRDPGALVWEEGLPVLYTGGASQMEFYNSVIQAAEQRMKPMGVTAPFDVKPLPVPFELRNAGITRDVFLRLGTAYGLSYGEEVGIIRPSRDFPDIPRPTKTTPPAFVSKDFV